MHVPFYLLALFFLFVLLGGVGCSDKVSDNVENPEYFGREGFSGPPGNAYSYRGRIEGDPVFVGTVRDFVPGRHMPAHVYSVDEGWRTGTLPQTAWRVTDPNERIVAAGDAYFFLEHIPGDKHSALFRTTDGGASWEALEVEPTYAFDLRAGADVLYLYEERFENSEVGYVRKLWRSVDAGGSWEVIHDNLAARGYAVVGDTIVVNSAGGQGTTPQVSRDRGETWAGVEPNSSLAHLLDLHGHWQRIEDVFLTTVPRAEQPQIFEWSFESGLHGHTVDGLQDGIHWVEVAGESIFASTSSGQVGVLTGSPGEWSTEPPSWEPLSLPEGAALHVGADRFNPERNLFGFADGSLAVLTESGLLQLDRDEQTWKPIGHGHSSADYILEPPDGLISGRSGQFFRRLDNSWTPLSLVTETAGEPPESVLTRLGDELFAVTTTPDVPPSLFRVGLDSATLEFVWQDDLTSASYHGMTRRPSVHLLDIEGRMIIGSAGPFREVITASGHTLFESSGGGIFTLDVESGESQPLFDTTDDEQYLSVQQMVHHDGDVWVISATRGVWKVATDASGMTKTHQGLPADPATPIYDLVHGLHSTGDNLYAFSTTSLWALDGTSWTEVDITEFAEAAAITGLDPLGAHVNTNAIMDVDSHGSELVIATLEGVYLFEPSSGEFFNGRTDFDQPIYRLLRGESGLFVSLWQGGLYRLTRRE